MVFTTNILVYLVSVLYGEIYLPRNETYYFVVYIATLCYVDTAILLLLLIKLRNFNSSRFSMNVTNSADLIKHEIRIVCLIKSIYTYDELFESTVCFTRDKTICINILFDKAAKSIILHSPSLHLHNTWLSSV